MLDGLVVNRTTRDCVTGMYTRSRHCRCLTLAYGSLAYNSGSVLRSPVGAWAGAVLTLKRGAVRRKVLPHAQLIRCPTRPNHDADLLDALPSRAARSLAYIIKYLPRYLPSPTHTPFAGAFLYLKVPNSCSEVFCTFAGTPFFLQLP